jgi:PAS domain S-box-containing protein/putative nucleotidyltransferase with HDIG domain
METLGSEDIVTFFRRGRESCGYATDGDCRFAFDALIDSIPNAVFYKASDGKYLGCNQAFLALLGRPKAEILGKTDFDLFPSRLATRLFQWDSELAHGAPRQVQETHFPNRDGEEQSVLLHRSALRDAAGELTGFVGTIVDVTEERKEEQERAAALVMAAAAEMAIQTIEGMIDPVIILNSSGRIERVNRGYAELCGLARPVIGNGLSEVFLDLPQAEATALLKRCGQFGRIRDLELRLVTAAGANVPVLVNLSILRDSQRAIDGFIVAIRDVSSLVDAADRLRANQRTLDAILNASEDAVFLVDRAGVIQAGNKALAGRYGLDPAAVVGRKLADLPDEGLRETRAHFLDDIFASGRPARIEYERGEKVYYNSGFPIFDNAGAISEVAVFSYDITERKQGERLHRALYAISEAAYFAYDMRNLFRIVHRIVARLVPAENIFIVLRDADGTMDCPYYVDEAGEAEPERSRTAALSDGLVDHLIAVGRAMLLKGDDIERLRAEGIVRAAGPVPREWLGVPLRNGDGATVGALVAIIQRRGQSYGEEDRKILNFVSSQIAMAIERKRNEETLRAKNALLKTLTDGTILALVKAVEIRDPYTAGHQQRVSRLSGALARELGLSADRIEATRIAALLHDVGKISVPSELLSKPGRLSDLEFQLIRQHPIVSADILKSIDFPFPIARYVREHHEKMDGSGYPEGLIGDQISLESRIICVADVVDAMASHRPYRPSRGLELALEEIESNSSQLYDPAVTAACGQLIRSKQFDFDAGGDDIVSA